MAPRVALSQFWSLTRTTGGVAELRMLGLEIVLACPSGPNAITRSFLVRRRQESQRGENQDIVKDTGSF